MKKSIFTVSAIAVLALTSACAKSPESIAPVSMGNAFANVSCRNAKTMLTNEHQTLAALSTKQKQAVTGDALGVFLIGVPVSSLSGNDVAGGIGASKGKILALEGRLASCG